MEKIQIIHEIAMLSAKAACDANSPNYANSTGVKGYASDMVKYYLEASESAKSAWAEIKSSKPNMQILK